MIEKLLTKYRNMSKQLKVIFWFTFVGFLQRGISIVTTPVFTRVLSTEDYGLFSVFNAYYMVLVIVTTLCLHMGGINNAFVKNTASNEKIVSAFQSLSMVVSSVFLIAALIFRNQLAALMGLPVIVVAVLFIAFVFNEPYHIWVIYKRYQYDYVRPVIAAVIISIATPLIGVIGVLLADENQGIVRILLYALTYIILPGFFFYIVNYKKSSTFFDKSLWKYALSFNLPLLIHYLSETLLNQTDRIMINSLCGTSDAGIYSVAFAAASLFTIFSSALNTAFVPWTYQKLKDKDYRMIEKTGYIVLIFLAAILSVMIMFAPEIVYVLAGEKYTGAVYLIPTLSASVYFGYMYQLFSRIELYFEKKSYTVIATVTAAILNIVLNYLWIPKAGYVAAGYSTLIAHMLFCVLHYFFYEKVRREKMESAKVYDIRKLLLISLIILVLTFSMTFLYQYIAIRIAIVIVILIVAFFMRNKIISMVKMLMKKTD